MGPEILNAFVDVVGLSPVKAYYGKVMLEPLM